MRIFGFNPIAAPANSAPAAMPADADKFERVQRSRNWDAVSIENPRPPMSQQDRADLNMQVGGIIGSATVAGLGIGASLGSGVPFVGNVAGAALGAASGAIVGLIGSWFAAENANRRR